MEPVELVTIATVVNLLDCHTRVKRRSSVILRDDVRFTLVLTQNKLVGSTDDVLRCYATFLSVVMASWFPGTFKIFQPHVDKS